LNPHSDLVLCFCPLLQAAHLLVVTCSGDTECARRKLEVRVCLRGPSALRALCTRRELGVVVGRVVRVYLNAP
jgi:hypothetical protein